MAGIKGNFRFTFDRKVGQELRIPFWNCIDHTGKKIGIKDIIETRVGILIDKIEYTVDDRVNVRFKETLDSSQTVELNAVVDEYKNKTSYSNIELEAIKWQEEIYPVRDVLPTIESNLKSIYDVSVWNDLSFIEKRILAFWRVCTNEQALEVFTQSELDSFRFYNIYKFLEPRIQETLTREDIYKLPRDHDFKIEFYERYYKKRYPKVEGRPTRKDYFASYNTSTFVYSDKFAELNFTFIDDPATNLILEKQARISWTWNTGETDTSNYKDIGEVFHPVDEMDLRLKEAEQKRQAIYTDLQNEIVFFVDQTEESLDQITASIVVVEFAKEYQTQIYDWIRFGSFKLAELVAAITNDSTYAWLDNIAYLTVSIRDHIINKVSIS